MEVQKTKSSDYDSFQMKYGPLVSPISQEDRKFLFESLTSPFGVAMSLVKHYYSTGRKEDGDSPFLHDPTLQLTWTRDHLPYFSSVSKHISFIRNSLVHNGPINLRNIQKLHTCLENLPKENLLVQELLLILGQVGKSSKLRVEQNREFFQDVSKSCDPRVQVPPVQAPPTQDPRDQDPRDQGPQTLGLRCDKCGSQILEKEPEILDESQNDFLFLGRERNLFDVKNDPILRERIKGQRVKVLSGKWYGSEGTFRSWAGTVGYVDFPGIGKKSLITKQTVVSLII